MMPLRFKRRNKYSAKGGYFCSNCAAPLPRPTKPSDKAKTCRYCHEGTPVFFGSKREHSHFVKLLHDQKHGLISDIELQPRFDIIVNDKNIGRYRADFKFFDKRKQTDRIQDVKGMVTRDGELRRKIVEALYGVTVEMVR